MLCPVLLTPLHERLQAVAGQMTFRQLGELTQTHPETVRRYMQGQAPSVEFLAAICVHLGVSGEWILTGRGPMRATDMKAHALKQANAAELLNAMATTLERLHERVERLELFVNTMEARLRAQGGAAPNAVEVKIDAQPGAADTRARAVADAVPERSRPHDRGAAEARGA